MSLYSQANETPIFLSRLCIVAFVALSIAHDVRHGHGILARTADCCLLLIDHRVDCLHDALGVLVLVSLLLDITVEYADVDDDNGAIPVVIIRDEYGDICGDDCNDVDDDDVIGGTE